MSTTIAEYNATDAALADLRTKYEAVVYDVTNGKGMDQAKKARAEIRDHRVSLEKERVRIKAPALERCRQIDSEAKRITAELEALEGPIDEQIKGEEQRKEREKEEKARLERERILALNARFDAIKALPLRTVDQPAEVIRSVIAEAEAIDPTTFPDDMTAAAAFEKRMVITALNAALDRRLSADEEAERIKAERAELERLRAEQDVVRAEADRLATAERDRQAAEARRAEDQARAEREATERASREAREAEQARIDAERAEARKQEDTERAAAAKALREQQEAAAAERTRLEQERAAAAERERQQAIANASLLSAASEAVDFLTTKGFGEELVTKKLLAAISREPEKKAPKDRKTKAQAIEHDRT